MCVLIAPIVTLKAHVKKFTLTYRKFEINLSARHHPSNYLEESKVAKSFFLFFFSTEQPRRTSFQKEIFPDSIPLYKVPSREKKEEKKEEEAFHTKFFIYPRVGGFLSRFTINLSINK